MSGSSLDRELNLRFIVGFAIVLTAITVGMAALMWATSSMLRGRLEARDPAPPTLPAARVQPPPPGPQLQTAPEADMALMRTEEDRLLSTYEWVDREAGVARVPVAKAIELMAAEPRQEPEEAEEPEEPEEPNEVTP